jgi:hypothetical protein
MYLWIMIVFKTIINAYYSFAYSISNFFVKLNIKKVSLILFPFILFVVNNLHNEADRRAFITKSVNYKTVFNILFVTVIAIIIYFKKGEKNENL